MIRVFTLVVLMLASLNVVIAQEVETLTAGQYTYIPGGLVQAECYGSSAYDPVEEYETLDALALVPLEDGGFLSIWEGADFLFVPADDGTYTIQLLEADPIYTYEGTMSIVSPEEFHVTSVMTVNESCVYNHDLRFGLIDGENIPTIWTESERTFSDISFFNECLGRSGAEPGGAWANPDLLIPIVVTDDGLLIGASAYLGSDGSYIYEATEASANNSLYTRITLAGDLEDETLAKEDFAQLDERSDCQVISTSTLAPFDGDLEALLESIASEE